MYSCVCSHKLMCCIAVGMCTLRGTESHMEIPTQLVCIHVHISVATILLKVYHDNVLLSSHASRHITISAHCKIGAVRVIKDNIRSLPVQVQAKYTSVNNPVLYRRLPKHDISKHSSILCVLSSINQPILIAID